LIILKKISLIKINNIFASYVGKNFRVVDSWEVTCRENTLEKRFSMGLKENSKKLRRFKEIEENISKTIKEK
jgi:hypothetical protein